MTHRIPNGCPKCGRSICVSTDSRKNTIVRCESNKCDFKQGQISPNKSKSK